MRMRLRRWYYAVRRFIYPSEILDIRQFNMRFGFILNDRPVHLTRRKLQERIAFLQEELNELKVAALSQDLCGQADALIDLVYVAKGTAVMLGLPWDALWDDVHRANMEKVRGRTHRGNVADCAKPPSWVPPLTRAILLSHGYRPHKFQCEEDCHDD